MSKKHIGLGVIANASQIFAVSAWATTTFYITKMLMALRAKLLIKKNLMNIKEKKIYWKIKQFKLCFCYDRLVALMAISSYATLRPTTLRQTFGFQCCHLTSSLSSSLRIVCLLLAELVGMAVSRIIRLFSLLLANIMAKVGHLKQSAIRRTLIRGLKYVIGFQLRDYNASPIFFLFILPDLTNKANKCWVLNKVLQQCCLIAYFNLHWILKCPFYYF